jgi:hypothetical protein
MPAIEIASFFCGALVLMGLISMGPIMATYSGTLKCDIDPEKEKCEKLKRDTGIAGGVFIVVMFFVLMFVLKTESF